MQKKLFAFAVLTLLVPFFPVCSDAAIKDCDLSVFKGGGIDGRDLAQFIAYYAASNSKADVDKSGFVDSGDVAHFAGFFGDSYRLPNILLIISDDVGLDMNTDMYDDLIDEIYTLYVARGHASAGLIKGKPASTPALDKLAGEGMVFANAWAQPFCSPTRASIITGMFAAKTNVAAYDVPMSTSHTTFVQRLKDEANYSTAIIGKWHLAGGWSGYNDAVPKRMGFELFKGHLDSALPNYWNYEYHVQDDDTNATTVRREPAPPTKSLPAGTTPAIAPTTFAPVVRGADTIEYINGREAQNPDKPWFVWLAFNEAHVAVPQPYYHVPETDTMDGTTLAEMTGCGAPGTSSNGTTACDADKLMRAMTNAMDTVIGKVLEAVDAIPSDTYVIYIGDNGTWSNNIGNMYITTNNRGKTTPYESGARVPLVIRGPDIAAGSRSDGFVHAADLFSTCLDLAGLEVTPEGLVYNDYQGNPSSLDGVSLAPILFSPNPLAVNVRDPNTGYLLTEVNWSGKKVGARNAIYKVICNTNTSNANCTFYNLTTDPLEEYQLTKPSSCPSGTPGEEAWHYCRLVEVINTHSILAP